MRGFTAYLLAATSVAWLIPWPTLWPATVATLAIVYLIAPSPRPSGGKLARRRET